jgi:hypothetical protein
MQRLEVSGTTYIYVIRRQRVKKHKYRDGLCQITLHYVSSVYVPVNIHGNINFVASTQYQLSQFIDSHHQLKADAAI